MDGKIINHLVLKGIDTGYCEYCGKPKNAPNYAYHICVMIERDWEKKETP